MEQKHYKVFDNNKNKAIIMPEKGYKMVMENAELSKGMVLIGECDANGNCLEEISLGNFTAKPKLKTFIPKDIEVKVNSKNGMVNLSTSIKNIPKEVDGMPERSIDYQPTAEQLKRKLQNDKLAEKEYKKNREEMLKKVSTKPVKKDGKKAKK